ncbi:hypothetical protein KDW_53320 [Dictyobacter vulcani]|uniref:DUF1490 domain-containing protein n=1 Tax=Dictyobacter vulcani TaxID=2607529 RepID=A0A5J4KX99_9CHLR|nr:hypothetical protein [Dictyobacter vulcani]GER91170.1 hypothetical protein KDW_53320 [Dictyobacter vulcani]
MEFEDFVEPEIAVTAAVTAALCSPRARKVMRKGLVYGVAGILTAGNVATAFANSIRQGVKQAEGAAVHADEETPYSAQRKEAGMKPEMVTTSAQKTTTKTEKAGGKPA